MLPLNKINANEHRSAINSKRTIIKINLCLHHSQTINYNPIYLSVYASRRTVQ